MKKILSVVLIFVFCFALCVPILASDVNEPAPIVEKSAANKEKVYAKRGEKVAVDIKVGNNKGFLNLTCTLSYDKQNFTCEEVTSVPEELDCIFNPKDRRQMISWDTGNFINYDKSETIARLYFTVSDDAPYGEYPVNALNVKGFTESYVRVDLNVDITTIVVTEDAKTEFTGATIGLDSDISVNYFATLSDDHKDAKLRVTMNGKETVLDGVPTGIPDEYVFKFRDVPPQCMGDNIKAEIILGDTVLAEKDGYSVLKYCKTQLSKSAAQLGISKEKHEAFKTLIADILEYGAKAQIYKNYKTDSLVNAGISGKTEFSALLNSDKNLSQSLVDGVRFTAAGVYFDSINSVFVKFTLGDNDGNFNIYVQNGNQNTAYSLNDCKLIDEAKDEYVLVLEGVSATDFDSVYTVEIKQNKNGAETVVQTLKYSVKSYVFSMQDKVDGSGTLSAMAELARATYNYGLSAKAYVEK